MKDTFTVRQFLQSEDEVPSLPLTRAISVDLMRHAMAKNPGADFFIMWCQLHVEVDPWISFPILLTDDRRTAVFDEVLSELCRRYPKTNPAKLLERVERKLLKRIESKGSRELVKTLK